MRAPPPEPSAPSLRTVQSAFAGALKNPGISLAFLADGEEQARSRFDAYRRNVMGNWQAALASTYSTVRRLLGPKAFSAAAAGFCNRHCSHSGDLNRYGEAFPDWLSEARVAPPGVAEGLLGDLARLDARLQDAYYAPDAEPADLRRLAEIPPADHGRLRITLAPSLYLLRSRWPVARWWQALQDDPGAPAPAELAGAAWTARSRGTVWPEATDAAGAAFIDALLSGRELAVAIACAQREDRRFDPGALLPGLARAGAITEFRL